MIVAALREPDNRVWIAVPQVVSRASAIYVFAVAAHSLDAEKLGVLALASAVTAGAVALAPALVGKPMAVLTAAGERERLGPAAQSFAVLSSLALGLLLGVLAAVATSEVRLVLLAAAVGVPAAMAVESRYWRSVFLDGRRRAGLVLSGAYAAQTLCVTVAALVPSEQALVIAPFVGLGLAAIVTVLADGGVSLSGARDWGARQRARWLPYVFGVTAAVAFAQAVPIILALAAGLAAASVYRAGELAFGLTNLLIGVVTQTQLTQDGPDLRRTYRRAASLLTLAAIANGLALKVLPTAVLRPFLGPVADDLKDILLAFTVLRIGLGVASSGSVLLVRSLSARRAGVLGVASAILSATALIVGAVLGGLPGGVAGLAAAEVGIALYFGRLLRQST